MPMPRKQVAVSPSAIAPRLLTIKQAAEYLNATVWFVRTLAWDKKVPYVKWGHRVAFDRADLDRFVEARKSGVPRE